VLLRPIGGPEVMRRQLLRLAAASEPSKVTIRVLPFEVGAHRALEGPFIVLEFGDGADLLLVYSEGMTGGVFRTKPEELRRYRAIFEPLWAAALSAEELVEFIADGAEGIFHERHAKGRF
jgi:hypothetical protein